MPQPRTALAALAGFDRTGTRAAALLPEKADSVHDPTDIALWGLNTRSMLMKRSGRPRSAVRSAADPGPPAAAIHRESRARLPSVPVHSATAPINAAPPAAPPMKK